MTDIKSQFVVAATDGSPVADGAVEWAAAEAASRNLPLKVIRCWHGTPAKTRFDPAGIAHAEDEKWLQESLARKLTGLGQHHPDLSISMHLVDGDPADVLIEESKHESLVVLGTRSLGAFGSAMLGSVSAVVAAQAACPVVVVRSAAIGGQAPRAVVAAVNTPDDAHAVLDFAFAFASTHQAPLRVVTCAHRDLQTPPHGSYAHLVTEQLKPSLDAAVVPWSEKYPDVEVTTDVILEHRVVGLTQASADAQLLVVGRRGHHPTVDTLLGSVSQGVLHHAHCPVAVVPH